MLSRLALVHRHLARPTLGRFACPPSSAASGATSRLAMASSAEERSRRMIHTAGCLIIGDEVLGGKYDAADPRANPAHAAPANSSYFAKFCFSLGIGLKRIEVIADDEAEISEAVRRMSSNYDLVGPPSDEHGQALTRDKVVTSGGIGPTHDDITYESIAKAFGLELRLNDEAFDRMKRLAKSHPSQPNFSYDTPSPALEAKLRMIRLPLDPARPEADQVLFVKDDLWVPVAVVNGNVHILPGVPRLFEQLLDGLKPGLVPRLEDPEGKGIHRLLFSTPMAESEVATYLTELAARVGGRGIKVGSYPRWGKARNTVTLVGRDRALLDSLVPEVEANVKGPRVSKEDELDEGDVEADEG